MAGFGPVASLPVGADPSSFSTWGVATFPVASFPVSPPAPPGAVVVVVPPGQVLLAGQIAPTRQAPVNLPALAPRIPAPVTDQPRQPNFQRYYDWKRGPAVAAQPLGWDRPDIIPPTVLFRGAQFTRYRQWDRQAAINAQPWVWQNINRGFIPPWFQIFTG